MYTSVVSTNTLEHLWSPKNTRSQIAKQTKILQTSIDKGKDLEEVLEANSLCYEDLRYESHQEHRFLDDAVVDLKYIEPKGDRIPVVSFFSGAGGLDLGFEAAGFAHQGAIELNELFCATIRHNRPSWKVVGPPDCSGDVSDTEVMIKTLRSKLKIKGRFNGVFVGGPPCQPFSIAANQRFSKAGTNFKRTGFAHELHGNLLFDFVQLIGEFRPTAFVIENVPGLLQVDGGEQLSRAFELLRSYGYTVQDPHIVDAANFGVPQQRIRLFIIGSRTTHFGAFRLTPQDHRAICGNVFNRAMDGVLNHVTREHRAESVLRYMKLKYGERDQLGRVDRLNPGLPSKTVIAGGTRGGGRSHLHPYIPRTISVREAARLQTFPDTYEFLGPVARQFTQVGNAVPPVLAAQIANALACALRV